MIHGHMQRYYFSFFSRKTNFCRNLNAIIPVDVAVAVVDVIIIIIIFSVCLILDESAKMLWSIK